MEKIQTIEKIRPGVMIDGETYYPKGYVWVLGLALGGCDWAIKKADTPEFRELIRKDLEKEHNEQIERTIELYKNKITALRKELIR